jgi:16S rRNA (cytosine967-C5)-methyltransferase
MSEPRRPPARSATTPTARAVALEVVRRVVDEGAYSTRVLPAALARSGLDRRDRAFAAELAYGTLRRLVPLDRAIEEAGRRPVGRMTAGARHALRLGAYQLLEAGVAPHAAVGETVALVGPRERGFVNAVLRKLAHRSPAPPGGGADDDVAARTGMAPWAVRELRRLVGDGAETAAAAFASQAPLTLRANRCRTTRHALRGTLAAAGIEAEPGAVDPDCLVVMAGGDPTSFPGFAAGSFAVQDQASAFVARTVEARPGERILDVCAAPGGKAAALACAMRPEGVVVAADVVHGRSRLVVEAARRLGERVLVLDADARRPAARALFDRVLVDAPCSGIGAARRRPELLWRVDARELSRLARLQVAIAVASAGLLRRGGRLVYAVCTFPRAETDAACDAILRHRPDLRPVPTPGPDGPALRHRLWPHRHGTDGMFVAAFERRT